LARDARPVSRSSSIAKAPSPAPGLQKQPVRSEMFQAAASRATARSSMILPSGSRRLSATVPPRRSPSGGPYIRTMGVSSRCRRPRSRSSSQPVRQATRSWMTSTPMPSIQARPTVTSGMAWKLSVPSSNAASSVAGTCQPPSALTTLIVPPENQGRRNRASADRRAIKHPTPVG
jgi:hypothetical protein